VRKVGRYIQFFSQNLSGLTSAKIIITLWNCSIHFIIRGRNT